MKGLMRRYFTYRRHGFGRRAAWSWAVAPCNCEGRRPDDPPCPVLVRIEAKEAEWGATDDGD